MLGAIIVIDPAEIETVTREERPADSRKSLEWKQLNEFHFSSLWAVLAGSSSSEAYESKIQVVTTHQGEVWFVIIPDELTELIAAQRGLDISIQVSQWSKIDEFKWGWSESDVQKLFDDLLTLAVEAKKDGKSLIYWGSL